MASKDNNVESPICEIKIGDVDCFSQEYKYKGLKNKKKRISMNMTDSSFTYTLIPSYYHIQIQNLVSKGTLVSQRELTDSHHHNYLLKLHHS